MCDVALTLATGGNPAQPNPPAAVTHYSALRILARYECCVDDAIDFNAAEDAMHFEDALHSIVLRAERGDMVASGGTTHCASSQCVLEICALADARAVLDEKLASLHQALVVGASDEAEIALTYEELTGDRYPLLHC